MVGFHLIVLRASAGGNAMCSYVKRIPEAVFSLAPQSRPLRHEAAILFSFKDVDLDSRLRSISLQFHTHSIDPSSCSQHVSNIPFR